MQDSKRIEKHLKIYREELSQPEEQYAPLVQRAMGCMQGYLFDEELTVQWMKETCYIDEKNFAARFRKCVGRYPKEYVLYHRMEAGKILLQQTNATVTRIALALGFTSHSAFCKTFKKKTGLRPSEWREQN
ncbi:MAG TPA: helix-turn-helix transcriptional regulator [Bacteroidales bacterium]|nr:helix-turn-helix transcriptional regulator [Bacteroidales bacterium]